MLMPLSVSAVGGASMRLIRRPDVTLACLSTSFFWSLSIFSVSAGILLVSGEAFLKFGNFNAILGGEETGRKDSNKSGRGDDGLATLRSSLC